MISVNILKDISEERGIGRKKENCWFKYQFRLPQNSEKIESSRT